MTDVKERVDERLKKEFLSLNPEQREAVHHQNGPILVVAGAGSGKTRVATVRIAQLIASGVSADSIVGVTFTNKAAREMRQRVQGLVGQDVLVSTFHSLGLKILRESAHHIGYPLNAIVYDSEDSQRALKIVLKELSLSEDDLGSMQIGISALKNKLIPPGSEGAQKSRLNEVYERYCDLLKRSGAFDFDDLLLLPVLLFRKCPEILEQYQERWQYLLVDEYQDTNYAQSMFVSLLAGKRQNLFAVGDPDQSIYSWRGADVGNILRFKNDYESAKVVRLEENYRSAQSILSASNALIENNKGRIEKKLWSRKGEGSPITFFCSKTERLEASFIAESIEKCISDGITVDEIAVLFRTNAQSRSLEDSLMERRIPYRIHGGISFYQRKEVKDIFSYLRLVVQPYDLLAFSRAIQAPKRGLGATSVAKIESLARDMHLPINQLIFDIISDNQAVSLGNKQKEALKGFLETWGRISESMQIGVAPCIETIVFDGGYLKSLEGDMETYQEKAEIVSELVAKAHEWDRERKGTLQQFLEEVTLNQTIEEEAAESCSLMTIHNAKGLEFKVVFIVGLEEDILPHINSKKTMDGIEEERRLLYVAMTRAREQLIMTCSQTRLLWGGFRNMRPSQFLYEIPRHMLNSVRSVSAVQEVKKIDKSSFQPGQVVMHSKFGVGRVEKASESSSGLVYEVYFGKDGSRKKIAAEMQVLRPV